MADIPEQHELGDLGHTEDHNAITEVLAEHAGSLASLLSQLAGTMKLAGNNNMTVTNPTGYALRIVVPTGTRDVTANVITVTFNGKQSFGLDNLGHIRAASAQDDTTPVEVWGSSATQFGDLTRWRKAGAAGAVVAYVDANGNVYAPNLTPTTWTNLPLASGIAAATDVGTAPQYRRVGDTVELRGALRRSSGGNFNWSPVDLATLPTGFTPPSQAYFAQACAHSDGEAYVQMNVQTNGSVRFATRSGNQQPNWVSLDGMRFSRTA